MINNLAAIRELLGTPTLVRHCAERIIYKFRELITVKPQFVGVMNGKISISYKIFKLANTAKVIKIN